MSVMPLFERIPSKHGAVIRRPFVAGLGGGSYKQFGWVWCIQFLMVWLNERIQAWSKKDFKIYWFNRLKWIIPWSHITRADAWIFFKEVDYRSSNSASPMESRGLEPIWSEYSLTNNWLTATSRRFRPSKSMTASSGMGFNLRKFFRQNPMVLLPLYSVRIGKPWVRQIMSLEAYMRQAPSSRSGQGPKLLASLAFCRMWRTVSRFSFFRAMASETASIGKTEKWIRQQLPAHPFSQAICPAYPAWIRRQAISTWSISLW